MTRAGVHEMSLIMILGGVIFQGNITIIPEFFALQKVRFEIHKTSNGPIVLTRIITTSALLLSLKAVALVPHISSYTRPSFRVIGD